MEEEEGEINRYGQCDHEENCSLDSDSCNRIRCLFRDHKVPSGNTEGAAGSAGGAFVRDKYIDSENAENVLILIYDVKKGSEENEISYPEWVKEATAVSDHLTVAIEEIGDDEWGFAPAQPEGAVRLIAKNGKLEEIGMDGEDADGSKEDYLYHFLNWAKENQKADRTFVILSGHGGGIVGGFGMTDATSKDGMSLESIANILKAVDAKYDTVIFDACLEGSLETAYAMEPYADYMLASEQTIPLSGMDFSKAFHMLAENPAVPTEEVGRNIIKSFDKWNKENALLTGDRYTLSLVDLTMCQTVYQDYGDLMNACLDKMIEDQEEFFVQSSARSLAYDYNYGENDQADMGWIISRQQRESGRQRPGRLFPLPEAGLLCPVPQYAGEYRLYGPAGLLRCFCFYPERRLSVQDKRRTGRAGHPHGRQPAGRLFRRELVSERGRFHHAL